MYINSEKIYIAYLDIRWDVHLTVAVVPDVSNVTWPYPHGPGDFTSRGGWALHQAKCSDVKSEHVIVEVDAHNSAVVQLRQNQPSTTVYNVTSNINLQPLEADI